MEDKDRHVRIAAAHALDEIALVTGVDISDALPALMLALKTWDQDDRDTLVNGFVRIGSNAVPVLAGALRDSNKEVVSLHLMCFPEWVKMQKQRFRS